MEQIKMCKKLEVLNAYIKVTKILLNIISTILNDYINILPKYIENLYHTISSTFDYFLKFL